MCTRYLLFLPRHVHCSETAHLKRVDGHALRILFYYKGAPNARYPGCRGVLRAPVWLPALPSGKPKGNVLGTPPLNTQHSTLNTQHSTLNTQHPALNTQHSTLNTGPHYRGTLFIRKRPTPFDPPMTLGIGLRQGPSGRWLLVSEVPHY